MDKSDAAIVRDIDEQAEYERFVEQGREAAKSQGQSNWTLGDLALQVEIKRGERNLQQYADDIGVPYGSLRAYRNIAAAYPSDKRLSSQGWSIHQAFAPLADRFELIKAQWTIPEARRFVQERNRAAKEQEGEGEYFPERVRELSKRLSFVASNDELGREFEVVLERIEEAPPNIVNELGSALRQASIRLNEYVERLAERADPFAGSSTVVTVLRGELTDGN